MNGKILDSFVLQKPADWEPDFNVKNLFTSYFISNYSTTDFLESTGAQTSSCGPFHCCSLTLMSCCAIVPAHCVALLSRS